MRSIELTTRRAFTLLEVSVVVVLLVVITAMVVPNFVRQIRGEELPRSAKQLRSLIALVRANASLDGKRYQVRFPNDDEVDALGGRQQPRIEREDDPILEPEVFSLVTAPWAVGKTLLGDVWCAEVRLGRPTIEDIKERRRRAAEGVEQTLEETFQDIDPWRPPLLIEPDGTSEWATFVLTTAPDGTEVDKLEAYPRVELIADGATGLSWMQRPFYDEELDLFEEKHWPAVLRQDFLDPRVLTENDVLEIRETHVQGRPVELSGRKLQGAP